MHGSSAGDNGDGSVDDAEVTLLLLHAASTCFLAGLSWVVQLVVYPSFRIVGPTERWLLFHAAHSRRITYAVGLPWLIQGGTLAALLVTDAGPRWLLALAAACALATVALTVWGAVPAHERLSSFDEGLLNRLLRISAWRTAAWTIGAAAGVALVGSH